MHTPVASVQRLVPQKDRFAGWVADYAIDPTNLTADELKEMQQQISELGFTQVQAQLLCKGVRSAELVLAKYRRPA